MRAERGSDPSGPWGPDRKVTDTLRHENGPEDKAERVLTLSFEIKSHCVAQAALKCSSDCSDCRLPPTS